jgi:hypothetical protein
MLYHCPRVALHRDKVDDVRETGFTVGVLSLSLHGQLLAGCVDVSGLRPGDSEPTSLDSAF